MTLHKIMVEANDEDEARLIQLGLQNKELRATVLLAVTLRRLPSNRARSRVVNFALDYLEEQDEQARKDLRGPGGTGDYTENNCSERSNACEQDEGA